MQFIECQDDMNLNKLPQMIVNSDAPNAHFGELFLGGGRGHGEGWGGTVEVAKFIDF